MRSLEAPLLNATPEQIFSECVDGYKDKENGEDIRARLLKCKGAVRIDAGKYVEEIRAGTFKMSELPEKVTKPELAAVYKDMFSREKSPGRDYYDLIRGAAVCAKCPVCGSEGGNTNLDHYLPKSIFPTLCVTPNNLVPICQACNEKKGTKYSLAPDKRPLHLYFDKIPFKKDKYDREIPDTFLHAKLESDYRVSFYEDCPEEWAPELKQRVREHLKLYDLPQRYSQCVEPKIATIWSKWNRRVDDRLEDLDADRTSIEKSQLSEIEADTLRSLLREEIRDEAQDPNTWKSALYRAMAKSVDRTLQWFKLYEEEIGKAAIKYKV